MESKKNEDFEILFYLMNEKLSVLEIRLKKGHDEKSKSDLLHWIIIPADSDPTEIQRMKIRSIGTDMVKGIEFQVRTFVSGELRFDASFAKFMYNGEGHILMNCSDEAVPVETINAIQAYVSNI